MKPGQIVATKKINNWEITFRAPQISDAKEMRQFINAISKEKTYISKQGEQITLQEEEKYVKDLLKATKDKKALMIQAWHEGKLVGSADVRCEEKASNHVSGLGISIKKEYRGHGLGTALLSIVIDQVKLHLKSVNILILQVYAPNKPAIHLYQKLGFQQYGLLPKGLKRKGKYHDRICMYLNLS